MSKDKLTACNVNLVRAVDKLLKIIKLFVQIKIIIYKKL